VTRIMSDEARVLKRCRTTRSTYLVLGEEKVGVCDVATCARTCVHCAVVC
jgi:hypothetical protein